MSYFTIRLAVTCSKSSVYAGSSANMVFDAVNGETAHLAVF
jgi:hypothetical protein